MLNDGYNFLSPRTPIRVAAAEADRVGIFPTPGSATAIRPMTSV